jgi:hypothetical protein
MNWNRNFTEGWLKGCSWCSGFACPHALNRAGVDIVAEGGTQHDNTVAIGGDLANTTTKRCWGWLTLDDFIQHIRWYEIASTFVDAFDQRFECPSVVVLELVFTKMKESLERTGVFWSRDRLVLLLCQDAKTIPIAYSFFTKSITQVGLALAQNP